VLQALADAATDRLPLFQLALLHEDMHGEALLMTLSGLGLMRFDPPTFPAYDDAVLHFDGGTFELGRSDRGFQFDNELPATPVHLDAFEIDAHVVSSAAFADWKASNAVATGKKHVAAMHVTYDDAAAYAASLGRRLPTEAEWEFAALHSPEFWGSAGLVWEWTTSVFAPRPGFAAGPYRDYSVPSFPDAGGTGAYCQVLKGGSFATHARLKYPQYRNFYSPTRSDMFCGFRTCRSL
jgi:EgtB-related family protein